MILAVSCCLLKSYLCNSFIIYATLVLLIYVRMCKRMCVSIWMCIWASAHSLTFNYYLSIYSRYCNSSLLLTPHLHI